MKNEKEDGVEEVLDAPVVKVLSPREAMMATVVQDSFDTRKQAYLDEGLEPPEDYVPVVDALEIEEPEPEEIEPDVEKFDKPLKSADTPIVQRDGQTYINVKVDGVMQEVAVGDMVTHYQKNENADAKLGQANQMLNQARALQQKPTSTPPDDSQAPVVDETAVNAALNKLYDGDVDEAAKELTALLSKRSNSPQVNLDELVSRKIAEIEDHKDLKSSFNRFMTNDDFKHIVKDQTLMGKVDVFTVELQQDQAFMANNPSYEDILNEAGRRTTDWLQGVAPTKATKQIIESRHERKQNKPQAVNSRTARRGPPEETKAPTREDNIAKMAAARGQRIYNN